MMCYPSIDSLIKKVDSKYTLVTLAAQRARELTDGQPALIPNAADKNCYDSIGRNLQFKDYLFIREIIQAGW